MKLSEQILDRVKTRVANHTWPVNHKGYDSEDDGFRVEHTHPCSTEAVAADSSPSRPTPIPRRSQFAIAPIVSRAPDRRFGPTFGCRANISKCSPARLRSTSRPPPTVGIRGRKRSVPDAARRSTRQPPVTLRQLRIWYGSGQCASATGSFRRCRTGRGRRCPGLAKSARCAEMKRAQPDPQHL